MLSGLAVRLNVILVKLRHSTSRNRGKKDNTKVKILQIWLRYPDILVGSWSSVAAVGLARWLGWRWLMAGPLPAGLRAAGPLLAWPLMAGPQMAGPLVAGPQMAGSQMAWLQMDDGWAWL